MSIFDNEHLILKICELYYEAGLSQKEISARLEISRPQISRILNAARKSKLVEIKINNPYSGEMALENSLQDLFGLKDALVIDTSEEEQKDVFDIFCRRVAKQLGAYIQDSSLVGVMSGRTVAGVVNMLSDFERRELRAVPLIGGHAEEGASWYANAIAQCLAQKAKDTRYYILNAPVIVNNQTAKDILIKEPSISSVLELGKKCDVALVGIGQVNKSSTTAIASAVDEKAVEKLQKMGACASVCTSYINEKGDILETEFCSKMVGQSLLDIKKSKIIAIALGELKTNAITAALKSGFIDIFITDTLTAKKIIYLEEKK